jgi:hypothetical protein
MIKRLIFYLAIFALAAFSTRAASPEPADVKLKGRELEAMEVALRHFHAHHYSSSGDLKHFEIELRRHRDELEISFWPEYTEKSLALPARNKYGTYITYFVSLRTLKITNFHYERD